MAIAAQIDWRHWRHFNLFNTGSGQVNWRHWRHLNQWRGMWRGNWRHFSLSNTGSGGVNWRHWRHFNVSKAKNDIISIFQKWQCRHKLKALTSHQLLLFSNWQWRKFYRSKTVLIWYPAWLVGWVKLFNARLSPKKYKRWPRYQEVRQEGDCTYRYTVTTTMTPALRWAAIKPF